jgi:hypothetical protein
LLQKILFSSHKCLNYDAEIIYANEDDNFMKQENETVDKMFINTSQVYQDSSDEQLRYEIRNFTSARKS